MKAEDITQEGWYWCRQLGTASIPRVVRVFENGGYGLRMDDGEGDTYDLNGDRWPSLFEFLGPIPTPAWHEWKHATGNG
jgi:hypothetical protein